MLDLLLKLTRFKKENKELLTYILFEMDDEPGYVQSIRFEIDELLAGITDTPYTVAKKVLRKIPRLINKQIKYIGSKQSAVELHLHLARRLAELNHTHSLRALPEKIFAQQLAKIDKLLPGLTDDLQHDFQKQVNTLTDQSSRKKSWWKK